MSGMDDLARSRHRWIEFGIESLIRIVGFSSIGFLALIFAFLLREGVSFFLRVPLGNLLSIRWYPTFGLFGTLPLILGSILVTVAAKFDYPSDSACPLSFQALPFKRLSEGFLYFVSVTI